MSGLNRPAHYQGKYECKDVIKDLLENSPNSKIVDFNRMNALKYIWRAGNKDDLVKDLEKAVTFLEFAIEDALEEYIKK